jgi:hypothetical protein
MPSKTQSPTFVIHAWFKAKVRNAAAAAGDPEWSALYCGQENALVKHGQAVDLMPELIADLEEA